MNGSTMGNVKVRPDLTNEMRIATLANVADESRTMQINGLAQARTNGWPVLSALPLAFERTSVSFRTHGPRVGLRG
jgi:hypothetical protein